MALTLILGGARSGKSRMAQSWALAESPHPTLVATSRPWDAEHTARIDRHRRDRGPSWQVLEEQLHPARATGAVIVVDCVTLWLTNLFVDLDQDLDTCLSLAHTELQQMIGLADSHWLLVSNEVGLGVAPETQMGNRFRDLQGFFNQHAAQHAENVVFMVSGLPWTLKGRCPPGLPAELVAPFSPPRKLPQDPALR